MKKLPNKNLNIATKLAIIVVLLGSASLFIGCTNTPNSITITPTQGTCVQANMYTKVTPPPAIMNNPTSAPYCMSITIQNNNSGTNANNIQILNTGLVISGVGINPGGILYDPVAAQINISNQRQSYGNIGIYDPKNCVTNQGANVNTLGVGQNCVFYLQLSGESYPVGIYPSTLTYNYTNGNQNYAISTSINQRVYLYGGAPSGLVYISTNLLTSTTPPSWLTGLSPTTAPVPYIIEDGYGFVYFAAGNTVYVYRGVQGPSATQLGGNLPSAVNSIAFDTSGNVYAATNSNGVYVFNRGATSTPNWYPLTGQISNSTRVIGLTGYAFTSPAINQLYAITESSAYVCNPPNVNASGATCAWSTLTGSPTGFDNNAVDIDSSGNLYAGYESGVSRYSNGWQPFSLPNGPTSISGVSWYPSSPNWTVYLGANKLAAPNPTVYTCTSTSGLQCSVLTSSKSGVITGSANSVTTDGVGNVCVTGQGLNSANFNDITNTTGACLLNVSAATTSTWIPIQTGNLTSAPVNYGIIASMLTTY